MGKIWGNIRNIWKYQENMGKYQGKYKEIDCNMGNLGKNYGKDYLQKWVSFPQKVMASQPTHPPKGTPARNKDLWSELINRWFPFKGLIKPLFLEGGTLEGGRLTSHKKCEVSSCKTS